MLSPSAMLRRMKRMSCWIARFLVLVMLAPAFIPVALARTPDIMAAHCMRRNKPLAQADMPCHHAKDESDPSQNPPSTELSEDTFRATDNCCGNHDCCCRLAKSEFTEFVWNAVSSFHLVIGRATQLPSLVDLPNNVFANDSARAPPRV